MTGVDRICQELSDILDTDIYNLGNTMWQSCVQKTCGVYGTGLSAVGKISEKMN